MYRHLQKCLYKGLCPKLSTNKDKEAQIDFLTQTNDNGVMTRPIWELMNRLPMFENCENDGLENTIWFADRVVNIPSSVRCKDL